ncbi:hypothetical protein CYMTET_48038, partial [Cymbomonas tetramitiformis]
MSPRKLPLTFKYLIEVLWNIGTFRICIFPSNTKKESVDEALLFNWRTDACSRDSQGRTVLKCTIDDLEPNEHFLEIALPDGLDEKTLLKDSSGDQLGISFSLTSGFNIKAGEDEELVTPSCSPTDPLVLYCRHCSAALSLPFQEALLLPSSGWRELAQEFWFCGNCCPPEQTDEVLQQLQEGLQVSPLRCFVGQSIYSVSRQDVPGIRIETGTDSSFVRCLSCDHVVGTAEMESSAVPATASADSPKESFPVESEAAAVTASLHQLDLEGAGHVDATTSGSEVRPEARARPTEQAQGAAPGSTSLSDQGEVPVELWKHRVAAVESSLPVEAAPLH